jgi:hypothetical protein
MTAWVSVPNGKDGEGIFNINVDHIVVYYDVGPIAFEGDDEPSPRVHVILSDGSRRVFNMTAREFTARIPVRGR